MTKQSAKRLEELKSAVQAELAQHSPVEQIEFFASAMSGMVEDRSSALVTVARWENSGSRGRADE